MPGFKMDEGREALREIAKLEAKMTKLLTDFSGRTTKLEERVKTLEAKVETLEKDKLGLQMKLNALNTRFEMSKPLVLR